MEKETKPALNEKQIALMALKEQGLSIPEAAKVLGYNKDYAYHAAKKLSKYSLTNNKMVKGANKVVKNILAGETWGAIDKIKDSSALMAAQMVYDRVDPVKRTDQGPVNITFTQINLEISNERNDV